MAFLAYLFMHKFLRLKSYIGIVFARVCRLFPLVTGSLLRLGVCSDLMIYVKDGYNMQNQNQRQNLLYNYIDHLKISRQPVTLEHVGQIIEKFYKRIRLLPYNY